MEEERDQNIVDFAILNGLDLSLSNDINFCKSPLKQI